MFLAYLYIYSELGGIELSQCGSTGTNALFLDLQKRNAFGGVTLGKGEPLPAFIERIGAEGSWANYDAARTAAEASGVALQQPICGLISGQKLDLAPKPGFFPGAANAFRGTRQCRARAGEPAVLEPGTVAVDPVTMTTPRPTGGAAARALSAFVAIVALFAM